MQRLLIPGLDRRETNLIAALEKARILPARAVYVSTSALLEAHEALRHAEAPGLH